MHTQITDTGTFEAFAHAVLIDFNLWLVLGLINRKFAQIGVRKT